jgi:hypothetical protein
LVCTRVNRGLMTICNSSTDILPASISVVAVNCGPLGSPVTHHSWLLSCSVFVPRTGTLPVLSRLGWPSLIIVYSIVSYCYYYLNQIGYVTFNATYYLEDAAVVLTVQWIVNPHVTICDNMYRTVVVYLIIKDIRMISSLLLCVFVHIIVAIDSIKSLFY